MLQFWKKSGQKEKVDKSKSTSCSPSKSPKSSPSLSNGDVSSPTSLGFEVCHVGPLSGFNDEGLFVENASDSNKKLCEGTSHSRLSQTLAEVVSDKGALGYFIQYLEACESISLIKFWLDVESFCVAASGRVIVATPSCQVCVTRSQLENENSSASLPSPSETQQHSVKQVNYSELPLPLSKDSHSRTADNSIQSLNLPLAPLLNDHLYCDIKTNCTNPLTTDFPSRNVEVQEGLDIISGISSTVNNLMVDTEESSFTEHAPVVNPENLKPKSEIVQGVLPSDSSSVLPGHTELSENESNVLKCDSEDLIRATLTDAVRIYKKYLARDATHPVLVSDEVRDQVAAAICNQHGLVPANCFSQAQKLVYHIMENNFFNDFLHSDFHCKHQIDVLTSGNVSLSDILYNETALFYFMEFMEQEGNQSLIEFWLAAVNFHQHLLTKEDNYDATEAQNDAIILYEKYFSLQATCPLGFSDKVRFEVEHNICREEGPLPICFEKPVAIVVKVLQKNYLQPFITSQLYFKYLSELINTIQSNPSLVGRNKKCGSECSSEHSISIQNTLLAMEDAAPPRKIIRNVDDREMSIDARQLYDPDLLWRRRHQSGLSFGRINEMGRFETDVEPEPDKKESRITRVVRKLVNFEEDKAKEEMAWQIAEMIVKDITNVTLGSQEYVQS